jgi:hypothetical protein
VSQPPRRRHDKLSSFQIAEGFGPRAVVKLRQARVSTIIRALAVAITGLRCVALDDTGDMRPVAAETAACMVRKRWADSSRFEALHLALASPRRDHPLLMPTGSVSSAWAWTAMTSGRAAKIAASNNRAR